MKYAETVKKKYVKYKHTHTHSKYTGYFPGSHDELVIFSVWP